MERFGKTYRILDLDVTLTSDSREFPAAFDRDYRLFENPCAPRDEGLVVDCRAARNGTPGVLRINEETYPLDFYEDPVSYALQVVNGRIMEENRGHIVLHAGVVAAGGRAVLLCGPPGAGKTTLVLKLVESGALFFSDDYAPVHRETGLVRAFPRSAWIEESSPFPHLMDRDPSQADTRGSKRLMRLDHSEGLAGRACPAGALICLDPHEGASSWNDLALDARCGPDHPLVKSVQGLEGIEIGAVSLKRDRCSWLIRYPTGRRAARELRSALAAHRDVIRTAHSVNRVRPDFDRDPVLKPIPRHEAIFHVLGQMKQEFQDPEPCRSAGGKEAMACFVELNVLLRDTACYRLGPGNLEAMKDLALSTLAQGG
jgi:hypothetical protein